MNNEKKRSAVSKQDKKGSYACLEEFLRPATIYWTVPEWLADTMDTGKNFTPFYNKDNFVAALPRDDLIVVEGKMQDHLGGAQTYNELINNTDRPWLYHEYHYIFRADFYAESKLVPGQYAVAQQHALSFTTKGRPAWLPGMERLPNYQQKRNYLASI
jgi:hypothetical protein